jgi:polar amino acid transport system substrate-binding protein
MDFDPSAPQVAAVMAERYIAGAGAAARLGSVALLCLGLQLPALAETRVLLTLEWPPYTAVKEPGGGTITSLVNQVFKAMGDDTRVGYFSWHRVLQLPRTDRRFAASYPMYYSDERAQRCYFSDPIGEGPVGLAEPKNAPLKWQQVADLKNYRIGVVRGYVNSPDFDQRVTTGEILTVAAETDAENLRNLLAGRVQAAIVDENTFHYMNSHTDTLIGMEKSLQLNSRLLTVNKVYMCFPKDKAGLALRQRFNHSLRHLDLPMPGHSERPSAQ